MEQLKWVVLAIAVVMYALVIAFQKKKVWFTSIGMGAISVEHKERGE